GRMRRDAVLRVPEHGEVAVLALACGAAGAGLALVARLRHVLEVRAARALQQVPARRREVAQLPRRAGEHGLRQHRIPRANAQIGGEVAVADAGADVERAAFARVDA